MRITTILVQPGTIHPKQDPFRCLMVSLITLISLCILKFNIFIQFAVIHKVENDITYWRLDVPEWIQIPFTIMTTFSILSIAYFYRKQ